jgi:hypothetical protein
MPGAASFEWFSGGGGGATRHLPLEPRVVDRRGVPDLRLTLIVARTPTGKDASLLPLIAGGFLAVRLTMAADPEALAASEHPDALPLPARSIRFQVLGPEGHEMLTGSSGGPEASLTGWLDRGDACRVLRTLTGGDDGVRVQARVEFDEPAPVSLRVTGIWSVLREALIRESGSDGAVDAAGLERASIRAAAIGGLRIELDDVPVMAPGGAVLSQVIGAIASMAGPVLRRVSTDPDRWEVREAIPGGGGFEVRRTVTNPAAREVTRSADLRAALGRTTVDVASLVQLVGPGPTGAGVVDLPPRQSSRSIERVDPMADRVPLAAMKGVKGSPAVLLGVKPSVRPIRAGQGGLLSILGVRPATESLRSLPMLDSAAGPTFADRVDGNRRWYVPVLRPVAPEPTVTADASPFRFEVERVGATADGQPALRATVVVVLEAVPSVGAAVQGASPVPLLDVAAELSIPCVDSSSGKLVRIPLKGLVRCVGDRWEVSFTIGNEWARASYGVLSTPGFQAEQAEIVYAFRFEGYRRATPGRFEAIFGAKAAMLTAGNRTLHPLLAGAVAAQVRLEEREPPAEARRPLPLKVLVRPQLAPIAGPEADQELALEQRLANGRTTLMVPCQIFGGLYGERADGAWRSIGCQEAYRLGAAPTGQYQEVLELRNSWHTVHRSLPQPGRFLVVPRFYRLGRYPIGDPYECRPRAMLGASIAADNPEENRFVFTSFVEPDLPPFVWRDLLGRLAALAPPGSIATDLPSDVAVATTLGPIVAADGLDPPTVVESGTGFVLSISCRMASAALLRTLMERSGIAATLSFGLADGSTLESAIDLSLDRIVGPAPDGPIRATRVSGGYRLENRVEGPVDVRELRWYSGPGAYEAVPVGIRFGPRELHEVSAAARPGELAVEYGIVPGTPAPLEERNVFIEDLTAQVLFVCGVDYAARGLADIRIETRVTGTDRIVPVPLTGNAPRSGDATFTFPLSRAVELAAPSDAIEFRTTRVQVDGKSIASAWRTCPSAVVDLTWDLLSQPQGTSGGTP